MSTTFSPRSYRTALLEHLANSSKTPFSPSPSGPQQHCDGVFVENSRLYMGSGDSGTAMSSERLNVSAAAWRCSDASGASEGNGNPRSFVMNFIDQCVANHVPESLIVEHVLFMVHAMQEQLSLTEALHTRFHHDRLRQYEMSELTNMLQRQDVYYNQLHHGTKQSHVDHAAPCATTRRRVGPPFHNIPRCMNSQPGGAVVAAAHATSGRNKKLMQVSNDGRTARVAFTQTPRKENVLKQPAVKGSRGAHVPTFQHFMRPTDASNRKERRRYTQLYEQQGRQQKSSCSTQMAKHRIFASQNEAAAWRGRQRLMDSYLTWSDADDDNDNDAHDGRGGKGGSEKGEVSPIPELRCAAGQKSTDATLQQEYMLQLPPTSFNRLRSMPLHHEKGVPPSNDRDVASSTRDTTKEEEEKEEKVVSVENRKGMRHSSPTALGASALMSVHTPSLFPNPKLQAYIERSQRKVREAERVLANTPPQRHGGRDRDSDWHVRQSSASHSPLSGVLSELSES